MVENAVHLDQVFGSLASPVRRDILRRVAERDMTPTQLRKGHDTSLAAISKHLGVLERAGLIVRQKSGREHVVRLAPAAIQEASEYLAFYRQFWESSLDALENYLITEDGRE